MSAWIAPSRIDTASGNQVRTTGPSLDSEDSSNTTAPPLDFDRFDFSLPARVDAAAGQGRDTSPSREFWSTVTGTPIDSFISTNIIIVLVYAALSLLGSRRPQPSALLRGMELVGTIGVPFMVMVAIFYSQNSKSDSGFLTMLVTFLMSPIVLMVAVVAKYKLGLQGLGYCILLLICYILACTVTWGGMDR